MWYSWRDFAVLMIVRISGCRVARADAWLRRFRL